MARSTPSPTTPATPPLPQPSAAVATPPLPQTPRVPRPSIIQIDGNAPVRWNYAADPPRPDANHFVRHTYALNQQPVSYGSDEDESASLAATTEAEQHKPVKLPLPPDANDLYRQEPAHDTLQPVEVLEFIHVPAARQQAHVQLYDDINRLQSELVPPATDINGALEPFPAPEWRMDNQFQPAVFLRALPAPKRFRLLLSMPHLTCGVARGDQYAPSLENYRRAVGKLEQDLQPEGGGGEQIFVHQTTFAVINSDLIIMARTANDEMSSPEPFFPHQYRVSALHLLVHMIATLLRFSRRRVLDQLREKALNLDLRTQMHTHVWSASTSTSKGHANHRDPSKKLKNDLGMYIVDLRAISHLVQEQLQVLDDVATFVHNHALDERDKGFNQDIFRMPLLLQREEHNRIVLDALKMVTDEREEFRARVGGLLTDARSLLRDMTDATNCHYITQRNEQAEKHEARAKMSAETMSMFTVVTTIFLPLTFFTSYFTLAPGEATVRTHAQFWMYAAVPTFAFMALTLWIVLVKKHSSGEDRPILRFLRRLRLLSELSKESQQSVLPK